MEISNDLALLVLRVFLGLFFAIAGFRKVFVPSTVAKVWATFEKYGVSKTSGHLVVWGQLLGGLGLLFGALTNLAAFLLLPIMIGAFKMHALPKKREEHPNSHWSNYFSSILCTAEIQMIGGLIVLTLAGAGSLSLDYLFSQWVL